MSKIKNKEHKLNQLTKRYNACAEAVELLGIMRSTNSLLLKKVRKVYPDEHQDEELIKSVKTIEYDLIAITEELKDLAMALAEDGKDIRENRYEDK